MRKLNNNYLKIVNMSVSATTPKEYYTAICELALTSKHVSETRIGKYKSIQRFERNNIIKYDTVKPNNDRLSLVVDLAFSEGSIVSIKYKGKKYAILHGKKANAFKVREIVFSIE